MTDLIVPARFNGPARSGNGGFVSGSLAERVSTSGPVEVTLRRPPPLETPMRVTTGEDGTTLSDDDGVVATARAVDLVLDAVEEVPPDVAAAAMLGYPGLVGHPFPTCFACGPDRADGDGLRIFPGPVADAVLAAPWRAGDLSGEANVPPEIVWSALDCPGIWAHVLVTTGTGEKAVTGSLTVQQLRPAPARGTTLVLAWPIDHEGRKIRVGAALTTERGDLLAIARQTLIVTDRGVPLDLEAWRAAPAPSRA